MTDQLALMVAIARNGAIGLKGDLPWNYPEDRAWFEEQTEGHAVIMGRRTFEERGVPFGLPSFVVSKTLVLPNPPPENVSAVADLDEAIRSARKIDSMPFVIGGVGIFQASLPQVTRIFLTEIPESPVADTFFTLDTNGFVITARKTYASGLSFITMERRAPAAHGSAAFHE